MLTVGLAVATAAIYTFQQPPVYEATMKVVVGQGEGFFRPELGDAADPFTQTMSDLLASDVVADEVIDSLDLRLESGDLLENLSVSTKPSTAVLDVSYRDTNPERAERILHAVGDVFTDQVDDRLGTTNTPQQLSVSVTVFDPAHAAPDPVYPKPVLTLGVAGLLGLALGSLGVFLGRSERDGAGSKVAGLPFKGMTSATVPAGPALSPPTGDGQRRTVDELHAGLVSLSVRHRARSFLVTSAHSREGKSGVAAHLAMAIATRGVDVVVVDASFVESDLLWHLHIPGPQRDIDLYAIASGRRPVADALIDVPMGTGNGAARDPGGAFFRSNLDILEGEPAQRGRLRVLAPPADLTESFFGDGSNVRRLKERLTHLASYIVFNGPPLLEGPTYRTLADVVDSVVAVVPGENASADTIDALGEGLEQLRDRTEVVVIHAS